MKCFYHNDLDGRCAGAIVFHSVGIKPKKGNHKLEMIEIDYKDTIDVGKIKKNEQLWIVDFSFKPEIMERVLEKTKDITWIDHHKTADEYKYSQKLEGLRITEDKKFAGCELTWMYVHPKLPIPRAVQLTGDRDKWAWKFKKETANFCQGIKLYSHQPSDVIWFDLLNNGNNLQNVIRNGNTCILFRDNFCKDYADSYGFETKFEGYKCFAIGLYMFGSETFGERFKEYDICLSFEYDGKNYIIGLYSETIDVSKIAKKYGGGGHKGASGFVSSNLPFKLLDKPKLKED